MIFDFPVPQTVGNKCLWFISSPVYSIFDAASQLWHSCIHWIIHEKLQAVSCRPWTMLGAKMQSWARSNRRPYNSYTLAKSPVIINEHSPGILATNIELGIEGTVSPGTDAACLARFPKSSLFLCGSWGSNAFPEATCSGQHCGGRGKEGASGLFTISPEKVSDLNFISCFYWPTSR